MDRLVGMLIILLAVAFAYYALRDVQYQAHANRDFVAVPATIARSGVNAMPQSRGSGDTYRPAANYTYIYQDTKYGGDTVLALDEWGSEAWARGEIRKAAGVPGGVVWESTAYVDPENPKNAILVRDYFFGPYLRVMAALAGAATGVLVMAGALGGRRTRMGTVALDNPGWTLLLPQMEPRQQMKNARWYLAVFSAAALPVPLHWVLLGGSFREPGLISCAVALAGIAGLGVLFYRRWAAWRHMSDVRLRVKPVPLTTKGPVALHVVFDAYVSLHVQRIVARFVCTETYAYADLKGRTKTRERLFGEQSVDLCQAKSAAAGKQVEGEATLTLNVGPPSGKLAEGGSIPRYEWELHLRVELKGMVDFNAAFPVEVR